MDTDGRAARKEATRDAIRAAAVELFARHGYDHTTAADIAHAAGVSERTFFRHFPTKENVAFEGHAERLDRLASALADRPDDEPVLGSVRAGLLSLADSIEADREEMVAVRAVVAGSEVLLARSVELQADFAAVIARHVAERLDLDPETDLVPGLVANVVVGAVIAALNTWLANGGIGDFVELAREALGLLDTGLGLA